MLMVWPLAFYSRCNPKRGRDECIGVARLRAMIGDRYPDCDLTVNHGGRGRRNAGFLNASGQLSIEGIRICCPMPETNDVELHRRQQFQLWLSGDSSL
jgi:hypothetical protein